MSGIGLWIAVGATAFAVTAVAVEGVRRQALRRNVLDVPNARSSHVTPTPRGGGVAIVAGLLTGWAIGASVGVAALVGVALGTLLIAAISAVDDVRSLAARTRFAAQFAAVAVLLVVVSPWDAIAVPGLGTVRIGGGVLGGLVVAVWAVGLTNAYNFMDGIDGIAAGQAVVAGLVWAIVGSAVTVPAATLTGVLVAGAAAGFLVHNWSPARIFMGDVGSASLGFVFAALPVAVASQAGAAAAARVPLAGLLVVWPFVFDAAFTFLRRLRAGENVFEAHRSHLYQRMVIAGWSHRTVASLYMTLAILTGACAWLWAVRASSVAAWGGLAVVPVVLLVSARASARPRVAAA